MTPVLLDISNVEQMDEEMLQVEGLAAGQYQLLIDARPLAMFSADELRRGVNLALLKTPMLEQARGIDFFEERRATLEQARFLLSAEVKQTPATAAAENKLSEAREEFATAVRQKLAPKPHAFELRLQQER